jgi:hypothetical protein
VLVNNLCWELILFFATSYFQYAYFNVIISTLMLPRDQMHLDDVGIYFGEGCDVGAQVYGNHGEALGYGA